MAPRKHDPGAEVIVDKAGSVRKRVKGPDGKYRVPGAFVPGDPRSWRLGRHKSKFTQVRQLAQEIANEVIDEEKGLTKLDQILREWANSRNPTLQKSFIEMAFGKVPDAPAEDPAEKNRSLLASLPAESFSPEFFPVYRDILQRKHNEYVLHGGRGSTKSSFISLVIIWLLINHPTIHAVVSRKVANTMRDSVFAQVLWAIDQLGLGEYFKSIVSPMEIEYIPTGQKIYFRGADDPGKLKSIKPSFGSIAILWLEELDQFAGPETVRKIEQSVIRGGSLAWIFKSFNPPRTANNWANKYVKIPKDTQLTHHSCYLNAPSEWLGEPWIAEAEHLKKTNYAAYEHEYLGIPNSAGGQVFDNVRIARISDAEVKDFDRVYHGLDWGYYPDPAHYIQCHYDAARMKLYIFGEVRRYKASNRELYDAIKEYGYEDGELLIADSAEPKSVGDFRDYGATCRGAEKGRESVNYSMKWLQSLAEIVIDNERAPHAAEEFMNYEYERTKDDEIISAYPDKDNHAIDGARYATNHIWKRRGK